MIDPVKSYYHMVFLSELYLNTDSDDDIVYIDNVEDYMDYYRGMKFETFIITHVYSDGDCLVEFYDDRPEEFVELRYILEIK